MLQWSCFFDAPLPYLGQQQNRGDRVKISSDCSSAHVGHLAGSGAVAVDQFLDGDHRIACLWCPGAESAVGRLFSSFVCLSVAVSTGLVG